MSFAAGTLETALVLRAQTQQDKQAFSRLVLMHQNKVRSFLLRLSRNAANADDLAQEVFIIAYQKLANFRGSGEFGAWLCSIAYRCFLKHYRKQQRENLARDEFAGNADEGLNPMAADRYESISIEQMALEKALQQLSVAQTAAITLCESFGFSHSEAAAILNQPLGTVKSNVKRGKQKLREKLIGSRQEEQS